MRQVFSILLPKVMAGTVERTVKEGRYASKSEFFRDLLRMWLEGKIGKELSDSREELMAGRGKTLSSFLSL